MTKLHAIDKPLPLARLAYESLRDAILSGDMVPGERYSEKVVAEEMGISKTPVREALLELSAQGLISFLPRKGFEVRRFGAKDVEEVFEVRLFIEMSVAEKAAGSVATLDLGEVRQALEDQERCIASGDGAAFIAADRKFHLVFGKLIDNRRLSDILENVRDLIHVVGKEVLTLGTRPEEVVAEHREILQAIVEGDSDRARGAMAKHILNTKRRVLEHLQERNLLV